MAVFDDREKAQENKYFHDQDLKFRAISRRNKLFGLWAASQLGLKGAEVDAYAVEVVKADFKEPGDGDVLAKVGDDLKAKGIKVTEADLKSRLETCLTDAIKQLEAEKK
jgi:hypothetical protein